MRILNTALLCLFLTSTSSFACSSLDEVIGKCRDDVKTSAKEIFRTENNDAIKRVQSVGKAVRNCFDCAVEVISTDTKKALQ